MNGDAAPAASLRPTPWQTEFVERLETFADVSGLPPSHIRLFAWLVVCDPPHQSVQDLRRVLGLSAGAVSMATAALGRMGIVERIAQPGERRRHYRLHPEAWERVVRLRLEAAGRGRLAAEQALAGASGSQPRLEQMRDLYAWFETTIGQYLAASKTYL